MPVNACDGKGYDGQKTECIQDVGVLRDPVVEDMCLENRVKTYSYVEPVSYFH